MTIKRRWTDKKGSTQERILRPSHKERVIWEVHADDGEVNNWRQGTLHIVTNDEMKFEGKKTTSVFGGAKKEEWTKTFNQGEINLYNRFGDRIFDRKGREISFVWEPTLPTAGRK